KLFRSADLFCGAGGLSLGLRAADFEPVFALDSDRYACDTFRRNISECIVNEPIASDCADRIRCAVALGKDELALVCGGPPCQGFSIQRRGPRSDARNDLVLQF